MYICCKKYEKTNLKRKLAIVNYGEKLESDDRFIYFDGDPLMMAHSQDARDYFSKDDDGKGKQRFSLVHDILEKVNQVTQAYQEAVSAAIIDLPEDATDEERAQAVQTVEDKPSMMWKALDEDTPTFRENGVWNDLFYDADIEDLEDTLSIVERYI